MLYQKTKFENTNLLNSPDGPEASGDILESRLRNEMKR